MACVLSLLGAVQSAMAKPKPVPVVALSEKGEQLAKRYEAMQEQLKTQLGGSLPAVNERAKANYDNATAAEKEAVKDLENTQKALNEIGKANGLIGHAKNYWIPKADKGIAKAQADLKNAKTPAEREAAEKDLASWQKNRQDGVDALSERQANYDKLKVDEPRLKDELQQAQDALAKAKADIAIALQDMGLDRILSGDRLDRQLAKFAVLKEATPRGLAAFAEKSEANAALIDRLMKDDVLMLEMSIADGAADGNYGPAMQIYDSIQKTYPKSKDGVLHQLALAIALEHATPIKQNNPLSAVGAPEFIDPVARYAHYEKAYLAGELDPSFKNRSAWELRFVVDGDEPDQTLVWGREMLRNYRPDLITTKDDKWRYVRIVATDIRYGSEEDKNDKPELQQYPNILMNGGICGRRAFFGRFILRAFGVPTIARPQTGHAALAHGNSDSWVICLGAGWGAGYTKTQYGDDMDFLAETQSRAVGKDYLEVRRARWFGDVKGEPRVYGLGGKTKPGFWNAVAIVAQRQLIERSNAKTLAAVGEELGEANESDVKYPFESPVITDADRKISIDRKGVITIPAASTTTPNKSTGKIIFMDSVLGGKQLHYGRTGGDQDFVYTFDAPAAGTYALTMRVVTPSWKQMLRLTTNSDKPVDIELPHTVGLWQTTEPVMVELVKGKNILTFSRKGVPQEVAIKGITFKDFTLTPVKSRG